MHYLRVFHRLKRLCVADSQSGPAGLDLAEAVLHHSLFADRIVKLGWTIETHFQSQTALPWSIAHYHAFLSLMATNPQTSLVPTIVRTAYHSIAISLTGPT